MQSSTSALVLDPAAMQSMMGLADIMSKAVATVPAHFRGKPGDCLAVVMQAMQWGMNPYAIAQKTHLVSGTLGYEAQLVNAVIISRAPVKSRLHFEWFGDWSEIVGRFVERESKNKKDDDGNPQKYRAPAWDIKDEAGLGVRVSATLRGESEPRVLELLLTQARTRNSSLWVDDPKQQLAYLATKKWSRLYCPDVIMGVYTPDEMDDVPIASGAERATAEDKRNVVDPAAQAKADADAKRRADLVSNLETAAAAGIKTLGEHWKALPDADRNLVGPKEWERIKTLVPKRPKADEADGKPTYAQIMQSINDAADVAALAEAVGVDMAHLNDQMRNELLSAGQAKAAKLQEAMS